MHALPTDPSFLVDEPHRGRNTCKYLQSNTKNFCTCPPTFTCTVHTSQQEKDKKQASYPQIMKNHTSSNLGTAQHCTIASKSGLQFRFLDSIVVFEWAHIGGARGHRGSALGKLGDINNDEMQPRKQLRAFSAYWLGGCRFNCLLSS